MLPAFAYAKGSGPSGDIPHTIVLARNINLDSKGNLSITIPGYYEVTVTGNQFNKNSNFNLTISIAGNTDSSLSSSQWFGHNSITRLFHVTSVPVSLIVNMTSPGGTIVNQSCFTSIKWISS
jgi:hypothetical protein